MQQNEMETDIADEWKNFDIVLRELQKNEKAVVLAIRCHGSIPFKGNRPYTFKNTFDQNTPQIDIFDLALKGDVCYGNDNIGTWSESTEQLQSRIYEHFITNHLLRGNSETRQIYAEKFLKRNTTNEQNRIFLNKRYQKSDQHPLSNKVVLLWQNGLHINEITRITKKLDELTALLNNPRYPILWREQIFISLKSCDIPFTHVGFVDLTCNIFTDNQGAPIQLFAHDELLRNTDGMFGAGM